MGPVWIRTDRLWLRPFGPGDVDRLHELFNLPEVRRYLLDGERVTRAWVEETVAASAAGFAADGRGLWCAALAPDAPAVGFTGYHEFHEPPVCELLYGLDPAHWGAGLALEAARAAARHGFEGLGLDAIPISLDAPNEASLRLAQRLGARETHRGPGPVWEQIHLTLARADFIAGDGAHRMSSGPPGGAGSTTSP